MTSNFQVDNTFGVPENAPTGARIAEFVFRQLIAYALKTIRDRIDDPTYTLIEELFAWQKPAIQQQLKKWLREHTNIPVEINYPRSDIGLPFVSVLTGAEPEAEEYTMIGDVMGEELVRNPDGSVVLRQQYGVGLKPTVQVYIATDDPNTCMFLYHIIRFVLFSNKEQLTKLYDINALHINGGDLQHDEKFYPTFCYMRMISLQFLTKFDYNVQPENAVTIQLTGLFVNTFDQDSQAEISTDVTDED